MPAPNFKYLPHMADVAFVAYGKDFKSSLENSAEAIFNLMSELASLKKSKDKIKTLKISETASSKEDLVWFLLQKIVSKADEKGIQPFKFKIRKISKTKSRLKVEGTLFYKKSKEYVSLFDVKAVTPHELEVKQTGKKWTIKVLLDV